MFNYFTNDKIISAKFYINLWHLHPKDIVPKIYFQENVKYYRDTRHPFYGFSYMSKNLSRIIIKTS